MKDSKYLCEVEVISFNGNSINGSITTNDDITYRFINNAGEFAFCLSKHKIDNRWHETGGESLLYSQFMVDQLGQDIDAFLQDSVQNMFDF